MGVPVPLSLKRFFCIALDDSAFNLLLLSTKSISPRRLREQSTMMSPCISRSPRSLRDQSTMMSPRLSRSPRSLRDDRRWSLLVYLAILDASLRNMRMHLSSSLSLLDDSAMNLSASGGVDLPKDEAPPSLSLGVVRT